MARMPEPNKATLKRQLTAEVMGALIQRPDLRVVKVADGATDNWSYLGETLPFGIEGLDFYHATEHLGAALGAAYGEGTPRDQARVETWRTVLRDAPQGVEKVLGALSRLRTRSPRRQAIHKALAYFREHRHRMRYAELRAYNLPMGSGVVEAAWKTLVSQRLKRSGMRWRTAGGQAILTFRALCQSERFERAWSLLREMYKRSVALPRKIIAFSKGRGRV
jgi:pentatricopeptide repeat protein